VNDNKGKTNRTQTINARSNYPTSKTQSRRNQKGGGNSEPGNNRKKLYIEDGATGGMNPGSRDPANRYTANILKKNEEKLGIINERTEWRKVEHNRSRSGKAKG